MARAIYPFHTMDDGDVLFMASTNEVDNSDLDASHLGLFASELAWMQY
jgi:L-aminopeptidase/D-esterase-like protein